MKFDTATGTGKPAAVQPREVQPVPLIETGHGMKPDIRRMLQRVGGPSGASIEKTIEDIVKMGNDPSLRGHVMSELRAELKAKNRHAAVALGLLKAIEAMGDLAEATKNTDRRVDYLLRRNALLALGEMGENAAGALPELLIALKDPEVQHWAAKALSQMGKAGLSALVEALDDCRSELIAVQTLGMLGKAAEDALPKLRKRARWSWFDSELKKAAREAILNIENATDDIGPVAC